MLGPESPAAEAMLRTARFVAALRGHLAAGDWARVAEDLEAQQARLSLRRGGAGLRSLREPRGAAW